MCLNLNFEKGLFLSNQGPMEGPWGAGGGLWGEGQLLELLDGPNPPPPPRRKFKAGTGLKPTCARGARHAASTPSNEWMDGKAPVLAQGFPAALNKPRPISPTMPHLHQ